MKGTDSVLLHNAAASLLLAVTTPCPLPSEIPPGRYSSQGLIRTCPQGFYREHYVNFDAAEGTLCLPCNPGITTEAAGAGFEYLCNRVVPGHGIDSIFNVSGSASVPALPVSNTSGLPNATLCGIGFYSLGGWCAQCPSGTATRATGATTVEECGECILDVFWGYGGENHIPGT